MKRNWRSFVIIGLIICLIGSLAILPVSADMVIQPLPSLDDLTDVNVTSPNDGDVLIWDNASGYWIASGTIGDLQSDLTAINGTVISQGGNITGLKNIAIMYIIDGGGVVITTGEKGHLDIPFDCTITGWTILADQAGSIVIDVWNDTYANFPPTVADTIAGSEKPTINAAQKNQDLALGTWTTDVDAGDILAFNVDSCSTITRVMLAIYTTRVI